MSVFKSFNDNTFQGIDAEEDDEIKKLGPDGHREGLGWGQQHGHRRSRERGAVPGQRGLALPERHRVQEHDQQARNSLFYINN